MKPEWRRFAPLGLYLSLAATLVSMGLYVVYRQFDLYLQISVGLIVVGLALFALLDPDRARQIITGRQARYGSNAFVLSLAVVGIVVVINYLVFTNTKRWDLTEGKQFTLAPETIDTLAKLEQPVKAIGFFTKRTNSDQARSLLEQYQYNSAGKFEFEFVDPDANPALAESAKITRDGTIVLYMNELQEPVTLVSEEQITGALVRLMNPVKRAVYFLSGHGERSPDESGDQTFASAETNTGEQELQRSIVEHAGGECHSWGRKSDCGRWAAPAISPIGSRFAQGLCGSRRRVGCDARAASGDRVRGLPGPAG